MQLTKLFQCITLLALFSLGGCIGANKKSESSDAAPNEAVTEANILESNAGENGELLAKVFIPIANPADTLSRASTPAAANAEFSKALALMDAKKRQEAEGVLTLLTETYPNLSGPFVNLGIVQAERSEWEGAEKNWLHAIALTPTNYDAYTLLGVFYREQGRFADAEAIYLKALAVWPHHRPSIKNLGVLYDLYMGRLSDALAQYELYQQVLGEEDRQVKGWIIDLNRRLSSQTKAQE